MFDRIQHLLFKTVGVISGVTVSFQNRNDKIFHLVVLKKKKNHLTIKTCETNISSLEELKNLLPQKCPVVLNIEGWGVLVKEISSDAKGNIDDNLLPENNNDFEFFTHVQPEKTFVSIIRKEMIEKVLDDFGHLGFNIAGISAGPCSIAILSSLLDLEGSYLVGNWLLEFRNHEIKKIKTCSTEEISYYEFGGDNIPSQLIGALSLSVKYASGILGNEVINKNLNSGFAYRRLSFISGAFVLLLLFLGLFTNFMLFNKLTKEYEYVNREYLKNETQISELKSAEEELNKQKQIIERTGLEGGNRFAWYADRIAFLMPSKIILERMSFHPLEKRVQTDKEVTFYNNITILEGETTNILQVHEWISNLKRENWISDIELASYTGIKNTKAGTFSIEIIINEK